MTTPGDPASGLEALAKPATVLVERVSDAVGGLFRPWQTLRVAKAEADARKILAAADIEVTEMQRRALVRMLTEEERHQENIESITSQALPQLEQSARPELLDADWLSHFFDGGRNTSDQEMQSLWAHILAGETNTPGSYSRRTVSALTCLEKAEADAFTTLCGFVVILDRPVPLILDHRNVVYASAGIRFDHLRHLADVGLISFDPIAGITSTPSTPDLGPVAYFEDRVYIHVPPGRKIPLGASLFTRVGAELFRVSGAQARPDFFAYLMQTWSDAGLSVWSRWPRELT